MAKKSRRIRNANKAVKPRTIDEIDTTATQEELEELYGRPGSNIVPLVSTQRATVDVKILPPRINPTRPSWDDIALSELDEEFDDFVSVDDIIAGARRAAGRGGRAEPPLVLDRRIQVMEDPSGIDASPDLYMTIYVGKADSPYETAAFAEMFSRAGCTKAKTLDEADLVIFTGGADVDPALYGENKHVLTRSNQSRDKADFDLYLEAMQKGIPMLGVCRGAQFLHVMNGGKLFQDINGHHTAHGLWDTRQKTFLQTISSTHHQMVRPLPDGDDRMTVLGTSSGGAGTKRRWLNDKDCQVGSGMDIEAYYYRDTGCLGIQGHPEYRGYGEFTVWVLRLIEEFFCHNPDFTAKSKFYRMKDEFLEQRDVGIPETVIDYFKETK